MEWQLSIIVVLCTRVGIDISQNIQEQLKPLFCHMLLDHNVRKVAAEPVITVRSQCILFRNRFGGAFEPYLSMVTQ